MSTIIIPAPGPGARLKRAREARELSLQEVADALNLSARTVSLLEAETWSELPRPAFTRGYLRTFARLVGEDVDAILDAYAAAVGTGDTNAVDLKRGDLEGGGITEVIHKQPGTVLSGAVLAAAIVTGIVLWAVWPDESTRARVATPALRPPAAQAPANTTVAAPKRATAPPAAEIAAPTETSASTEEVVTRAPTPQDDESPDAPAPAAPNLDAAPTATTSDTSQGAHDIDPEEMSTIVEDLSPTARVRRITPEGDDSLTFTFTGDCWVEVKNGEGENLYSDLSRSGDVLELVGEAPFRLRLGFAPGVELAFNDERVVLTPHTRNNIASIVLGQ